jgi:hypothetical protein
VGDVVVVAGEVGGVGVVGKRSSSSSSSSSGSSGSSSSGSSGSSSSSVALLETHRGFQMKTLEKVLSAKKRKEARLEARISELASFDA